MNINDVFEVAYDATEKAKEDSVTLIFEIGKLDDRSKELREFDSRVDEAFERDLENLSPDVRAVAGPAIKTILQVDQLLHPSSHTNAPPSEQVEAYLLTALGGEFVKHVIPKIQENPDILNALLELDRRNIITGIQNEVARYRTKAWQQGSASEMDSVQARMWKAAVAKSPVLKLLGQKEVQNALKGTPDAVGTRYDRLMNGAMSRPILSVQTWDDEPALAVRTGKNSYKFEVVREGETRTIPKSGYAWLQKVTSNEDLFPSSAAPLSAADGLTIGVSIAKELNSGKIGEVGEAGQEALPDFITESDFQNAVKTQAERLGVRYYTEAGVKAASFEERRVMMMSASLPYIVDKLATIDISDILDGNDLTDAQIADLVSIRSILNNFSTDAARELMETVSADHSVDDGMNIFNPVLLPEGDNKGLSANMQTVKDRMNRLQRRALEERARTENKELVDRAGDLFVKVLPEHTHLNEEQQALLTEKFGSIERVTLSGENPTLSELTRRVVVDVERRRLLGKFTVEALQRPSLFEGDLTTPFIDRSDLLTAIESLEGVHNPFPTGGGWDFQKLGEVLKRDDLESSQKRAIALLALATSLVHLKQTDAGGGYTDLIPYVEGFIESGWVTVEDVLQVNNIGFMLSQSKDSGIGIDGSGTFLNRWYLYDTGDEDASKKTSFARWYDQKSQKDMYTGKIDGVKIAYWAIPEGQTNDDGLWGERVGQILDKMESQSEEYEDILTAMDVGLRTIVYSLDTLGEYEFDKGRLQTALDDAIRQAERQNVTLDTETYRELVQAQKHIEDLKGVLDVYSKLEPLSNQYLKVKGARGKAGQKAKQLNGIVDEIVKIVQSEDFREISDVTEGDVFTVKHLSSSLSSSIREMIFVVSESHSDLAIGTTGGILRKELHVPDEADQLVKAVNTFVQLFNESARERFQVFRDLEKVDTIAADFIGSRGVADVVTFDPKDDRFVVHTKANGEIEKVYIPRLFDETHLKSDYLLDVAKGIVRKKREAEALRDVLQTVRGIAKRDENVPYSWLTSTIVQGSFGSRELLTEANSRANGRISEETLVPFISARVAGQAEEGFTSIGVVDTVVTKWKQRQHRDKVNIPQMFSSASNPADLVRDLTEKSFNQALRFVGSRLGPGRERVLGRIRSTRVYEQAKNALAGVVEPLYSPDG